MLFCRKYVVNFILTVTRCIQNLQHDNAICADTAEFNILFFEIEGSKEKVKKEKIKWESDEACKKLKELVSTFFK